MKLKLILSGFILAFGCILVCPTLASDYKCTATTQECLDAMVAHYREKGWIGINLERSESSTQMLITSVVPKGPAARDGLKAGDRMTAMNGVTFDPENEEKLAEVQKSFKPGERFTFTILRDGKKMKITVTLGHFPADIIANVIGPHMLDHVAHESEQHDKTAKKERP